MPKRRACDPSPPPAETREARLAAALRANLARRKAQKRARQGQADGNASPAPATGEKPADAS